MQVPKLNLSASRKINLCTQAITNVDSPNPHSKRRKGEGEGKCCHALLILLWITPCENKLASGLVKTEKSCWAAAYEKTGQQQAEFEVSR